MPGQKSRKSKKDLSKPKRRSRPTSKKPIQTPVATKKRKTSSVKRKQREDAEFDAAISRMAAELDDTDVLSKHAVRDISKPRKSKKPLGPKASRFRLAKPGPVDEEKIDLPPMRPIASAMRVNDRRKKELAKRLGIKVPPKTDKDDVDVVTSKVRTNPEGRKIVERKVVHAAPRGPPVININPANVKSNARAPPPIRKPGQPRRPIIIRPRPRAKTIITKPLKGQKKPLNQRLWNAKSTAEAVALLVAESKLKPGQIFRVLSEIKYKSSGKRKYSDAAIARAYNAGKTGKDRVKVKDVTKMIDVAELPSEFQ